MRVYAYPETALLWAESSPATVGWLSRMRECFPIEEKGIVVPLVEKAGSTSLIWALLERWMPEIHEEAQEEVQAARAAGDRLGELMVRDLVQKRVCVRTPADTEGKRMVALMREPVERFWSAWRDKCGNPYGDCRALSRQIPRRATRHGILWWLMQQDPGRVDEHFAPQWTTLAPGAEVHAMTPQGIHDLEEVLEIEMPHRNKGERPEEEVPEEVNEIVRWLLGMDVEFYRQAVQG